MGIGDWGLGVETHLSLSPVITKISLWIKYEWCAENYTKKG